MYSGVICLAAAIGSDGRVFGAVQAQASGPAPCTAAEYRQLDFWIGDWNVFDSAAPTSAPVARVVVDRMLDGCALREIYQGANGTRGESFSTYDRGRRVWHQSWVTNRGQLLVIEGGLEGRDMVLTGADPEQGPTGRVRGVWTPSGNDIREVAETSTDGGKTWQPWFDLVFKQRRESFYDLRKTTPGVVSSARGGGAAPGRRPMPIRRAPSCQARERR